MDSPVSKIIVSSDVMDRWLPGVQILINTQSLSWDQQNIRSVVSVNKFDGDNAVIELDSPIPRPLNQEEGSFPVEVALLSRNIVIDRGHLTVYRTPHLKQVIQGVEFNNFDLEDDFKHVSMDILLLFLFGSMTFSHLTISKFSANSSLSISKYRRNNHFQEYCQRIKQWMCHH